MADLLQQRERQLDTDLDPKDLQAIFDSIEDNLPFWKIMYNDSVQDQDDRFPVSLAGVNAAADWLKMSSAPLYPSGGTSGVRGLGYRFLNLVVKVFGMPQIVFNRKQREFIGELLLAFDAINDRAVSLQAAVDDLNGKVRALEVENSECREEIESLSMQVAELRADFNQSKGVSADRS